jgi:hypothetical protein
MTEKKAIKIGILVFAITLGCFFIGLKNNVKAFVPEQPNTNGKVLSDNNASKIYWENASTTISDITSEIQMGFSSTTTLESTDTYITGIIMYLSGTAVPNGTLGITLGCGTTTPFNVASTNEFNYSDLQLTPTIFKWNFSSPNACNLKNVRLLNFTINQYAGDYVVVGFDGTNTNLLENTSLNGNFDYNVKFQLETNNALFDVDFHENFENNTTTPDFYFWDLDITYPATTTSQLNWKVKYKYATSSIWTWTDSYFETLPDIAGKYKSLEPLAKSTSLPYEATYQAQAFLFYSWDTVLATSSLINFTIATGTKVATIGTEGEPYKGNPPDSYWDDSWCPDTSFAVLGADFGKGVCKIFAFLFVPGQNAVNQWTTLKDNLMSKAPFSYFTQVINMFTSFSASSTNMSALTINTGTTTPIQINATLFSSTTMERYSGSGNLSILRTLMIAVLYLSFITMVIYSVMHIFKNK